MQDVGAAYEQSLRRWASFQRPGDARAANVEFDIGEELILALADDESGRATVNALVGDADAWVRLRAASHALLWSSTAAIAELEALTEAGPSLTRTTADYTLRAFRSGALRIGGRIASP